MAQLRIARGALARTRIWPGLDSIHATHQQPAQIRRLLSLPTPNPVVVCARAREREREGKKTQNPSGPRRRRLRDGGGRGDFGLRRRPALRGQRGHAPRCVRVLWHYRRRQGPPPPSLWFFPVLSGSFGDGHWFDTVIILYILSRKKDEGKSN
jgi:hypothetical protein